MRLTDEEHARISDAITSAEQTTSGEIFCVVARRTDDYRAVPFAWAALAAIVLAPLLLWLGIPDPRWFTSGGWSDGGHPEPQRIIALYAALSALLFILTFLVVRTPPVLRFLTPRSLKRSAVHRAAVESFLSHGIHVTAERTGVLIFLSLEDHVAEIVADGGIYAKVAHDVWGDALDALLTEVKDGKLADGFVSAIGMCGALLSAHFPPGDRNPNELPDKLIEI
ncbi:TPM domain-containing protein [Sphingosinicella soli]|uniref:Putative membrane protein n=1 Tax=Sphingosinicella soli TaxID=333708 RepID=A0A7W7B4M9_9SPHN|nr:TPM domain-containing protein [Sphingosinicella soli]MBB4633063.1 putative membrane protein [Sphingosinicella soli]